MDVFECYTRDQLRDFLFGNLSEETIQRISQHLDECNICEETVVALDDTDDTLIRQISGRPTESQSAAESNHGPTEHDPYFRAAVNRIVGDAENLAQLSHLISRSRDTSNPKQVGDYEIVETLARGGMGSVFKARHTRLQKMVAIKILPERKMRNVDAIARFAREMKIIGQMSHASMVGATDAGEDNGTHYLVMELVDGMDLGRMIRNCGPLRIADACELVRQAALGLEYAHSQNVIHRDVKPSNLMLCRDKTVKVLDLGLATLSGLNGCVDELTTVGQMMGTLDYMAPEQGGSEHPVDHRSDVYGLAATLYKLLTGTAPYSHPDLSTPLKKLRAMATTDPTPIRHRNQDIAEDLANIIDGSLNQDPDRRLQTAAEFAARIAPFCEGHDLGGLLERAEVIAATKMNTAEHVDASLDMEIALDAVRNRVTKKDAPKPSPSASRGWFSNFVRIAAVLGAAGMLAWAGITIYINTMSGQLIIESEIEDIKVTILHDEKPTRDLSIEHGTESTRLFAGKYRIEINGPSDGLIINNDVFELRRGETVVTRITRKKGKKIADSNAEPADTGAMRNLAMWEAEIARLKMQLRAHLMTLGNKHPKVLQLRHQIELWEKELARFKTASEPYFQNYLVTGDVNQAFRVLQTMLDGRQEVRLEQDKSKNALIILGNPADHAIVEQVLASMKSDTNKMDTATEGMRNAGDVTPLSRAEAMAASQAIRTLVEAAEQFKIVTGRDLKTAHDLVAKPKTMREQTWRGPYLKSIPLDPWGTPYQTSPRVSDNGAPMFVSAGPDKKWGSGDEITQTLQRPTTQLQPPAANLKPVDKPPSPSEPTYNGMNLQGWVDAYLSQQTKNSLNQISVLAGNCDSETKRQIIQSVFRGARNELSESQQVRVIRVVTELCNSKETQSQLFDYIRDFQRQTLNTNAELSEKQLWVAPLIKFGDETQDYLLELVNGNDANDVLIAIDGLNLIYKYASLQNSGFKLSSVNPIWLTSLCDLIESTKFSDQPAVTDVVLKALIRTFRKDPKTIALMEKLITFDAPVQWKSQAADVLVQHKPESSQLAVQIMRLIESAGFGVAKLTELVPANPDALPIIRKCLDDPNWGAHRSEAAKVSNNPKNRLEGLVGSMTSGGGAMAAIGGGLGMAGGGGQSRLAFTSDRSELIYSIGDRFEREESARKDLKSLVPLLRKEIQRSDDSDVLRQSWLALEKITGQKAPPLYEGRQINYWLDRLGKNYNVQYRITATTAIGSLLKDIEDLTPIVETIFGQVRDLSFDDIVESPETPEQKLCQQIVDLFGPTHQRVRQTSVRRSRPLQQLLLETLDELTDADAMLALQALKRITQGTGIRDVQSDALIRYALILTTSEKELVRRRAYDMLLIPSLRKVTSQGVTEFPGDFFRKAMKSEKNSESTKLGLLSSGEFIGFQSLKDSQDPRTLLTLLKIANVHKQRDQVMVHVLEILAKKPEFLDQFHDAYRLDLWSPAKESTKSTARKTVFEQLVDFLEMSPRPVNEKKIDSDHLEYYRPNPKLVEEGNDWETTKQDALNYLTSRLQNSEQLDRRLKTKIQRIIARLEPAKETKQDGAQN